MQRDLENLTIGGFAKASGVHVETVRFYQRRGLLRPPMRPITIHPSPERSIAKSMRSPSLKLGLLRRKLESWPAHSACWKRLSPNVGMLTARSVR